MYQRGGGDEQCPTGTYRARFALMWAGARYLHLVWSRRPHLHYSSMRSDVDRFSNGAVMDHFPISLAPLRQVHRSVKFVFHNLNLL